MELLLIAMVGATAAALAIRYTRGRRGHYPTDTEVGTITLSGVSPHPGVPGEQYVTITGVITGPTVSSYQAYGRFAWDAAQWPSVGDEIPVHYRAGKPAGWSVAHPGSRPYFGSKGAT